MLKWLKATSQDTGNTQNPKSVKAVDTWSGRCGWGAKTMQVAVGLEAAGLLTWMQEVAQSATSQALQGWVALLWGARPRCRHLFLIFFKHSWKGSSCLSAANEGYSSIPSNPILFPGKLWIKQYNFHIKLTCHYTFATDEWGNSCDGNIL